ncbi:hypothetical protein LJR245_007524 [Rhizobium leguminosarum]|uniref:hypothetical protein n=1 Tax=Rhizobium leguminosarum TaxID=384 RepID=UPI003ECD037F
MKPGQLFAELWQIVEPYEAEATLAPWSGRHAAEFGRLVELLEAGSTAEVPAMVTDYLARRPVAFSCEVDAPQERAFVVMCALDQAAMRIHPSIKTRLPGRSSAGGQMLAAMRAERTMTGAYAELSHKGFVLPKGLLMPGKERTKGLEQSGVALAHQFSFLSFVPALQKNFRLRPMAPPPSQIYVSEDAAQKVGLAPIAEDRDDLEFSVSDRRHRAFLDTVPHAAITDARIENEVSALLDKGAGLVVLPELVATSSAVVGLAEALRRAARSSHSVVLMGSGPSEERSKGLDRPFNEAVVMTGAGEVLFRQRKLNAFNMAAPRMKQCALPRADGHDDESHMEDCATGSELVLCDILGLGRVMVLICEDLEQQTPGGDIALHAQPDWILTPVLDVGLVFGRWEYRRAVEIGRKTGSRVVVSCSATLEVRSLGKKNLTETEPQTVRTGFCFDGSVEMRALHLETGGPASGHHMLVEWNPRAWKKHKLVEEN